MDRPRLSRIALVAAFVLLAVAVGFGVRAFLRAGAPSAAVVSGAALIGGPFNLVDQDGRARSDADFRGRYLLVYFGYTYCPDLCPTELQTMSAALDLLGDKAAKVQPLFITIDPERDTPERADAFAKAFDPRFLGLSGSAAEVAAVAKEYRVFFRKVPGADPSQYLMEHSSYVFLMDPQGRYVTLFTAAEIEAPDEMASRLRGLVSPES